MDPNDTMDPRQLPPMLKFLRVSRGWTQQELADAAGLTKAMVSGYERGRLSPSVKTLARLLGTMGYTWKLDTIEADGERLRRHFRQRHPP